MFYHIATVELTQEHINAIESFTIGDFVANVFIIPAIAIPLLTVTNWERIQKIWFRKMPWLLLGCSVVIGVVGVVINIVF